MNGGDLSVRASQQVATYVAELQHIVDMDSGSFDVEEVQAVGLTLAEMFERVGFATESRRSQRPDLADTYVATLAGDMPGKVVLIGHHDTVYPLGTATERPFRLDGGRAYGPGVMDMKGGLVLAVHALRLLSDSVGSAHPTVVFIGNPDEEVGSPTSRAIIEELAGDADLVLVLEPGREAGSVQTTRKGIGIFEPAVEGVSSHAGARPEDGRSAVLELAHKTIALHGLTDFATGTTVNVGVVSGGTRRNIVPSVAKAEIDLRAPTARDAETAHRRIMEIVQEPAIPGTRATVTGGLNRPPMEKTAETEVAIDVARRLIEEIGVSFLETSSGGGSNENFTAALGVPTLDGLGPVGRSAHSPD